MIKRLFLSLLVLLSVSAYSEGLSVYLDGNKLENGKSIVKNYNQNVYSFSGGYCPDIKYPSYGYICDFVIINTDQRSKRYSYKLDLLEKECDWDGAFTTNLSGGVPMGVWYDNSLSAGESLKFSHYFQMWEKNTDKFHFKIGLTLQVDGENNFYTEITFNYSPDIEDNNSPKSRGSHFVQDGIEYEVISPFDATCGVAKKTVETEPYSGIVSIPEKVLHKGCEYTVTEIKERAFAECTDLTYVVMSDSIKTIGLGAFGGCKTLKTVLLSNNLSEISEWAFNYCGSLTSIDIPKSLNKIGGSAFSQTGLKNFCINSDYIEIGNNCFDYCNNLESVDIECDRLKLAKQSFYNCNKLKNVKLEGKIDDLPQELFRECKELTSISLPNSISIIGESCFNGCSNLVGIVFPSNLKQIGSYAFSDCASLETVDFPDGLKRIESGAFRRCRKLRKLSFPDNIEYISGFSECDGIEEIVFPETTTTIGQDAFEHCTGLTEVEFTKGIKNILPFAFQGCINVESFIFPEGLEEIAWMAFYNCLQLKSISLPSTLKTIGLSAFYGCNELKDIYDYSSIPQKVIENNLEEWKNTTFTAENPTLHVYKGLKDLYLQSVFADIFTIIDDIPVIDVTSIELTNKSINVKKGVSGQIEYHCYPEDATLKDAIFVSSDESIVYVEPNGQFVGLKTGNAIITAHAVTNSAIKDEVLVRVVSNMTMSLDKDTVLVDNPQKISIAFDNPDVNDANVVYSSSDSLVADVTNGYVFANKEGDVIISANDTILGLTAQKNLICRLSAYPVIYTVDNNVVYTDTVKVGEKLKLREPYQKKGYTVSEWSDVPSIMPAETVEVFAQSKRNSYYVTFIADGDTIESNKHLYNFELKVPEAPKKTGYTFVGWFPEVDTLVPDYDVSYTAIYQINTYSLTYVVNGETLYQDSLEYQTKIIPLEDLKREGYSFLGWSEIPDTMPAFDVVVTGSFVANTYMLTYLIDGNKYSESNIQYGDIIIPIPEPTMEGYTFSGWTEIPSTMPAHDVTITGSYSINSYDVIYMVGTDIVHKESVQYGSQIPAYEYNPEDGYIFEGWEGDTYETMPAHDVIYVAKVTADAIASIMSEKETYVYDLKGVRVGTTANMKRLPKGIYIVNGKQVIKR